METLKLIANMMIYVAMIVALLGLSYALVWVALFFPVTQNRKHKEKVAESNREFHKVQVEHATIIQAKEAADENLKKTLYQLHYKEKESEQLDKDIAAKKKALEELNKKVK